MRVLLLFLFSFSFLLTIFGSEIQGYECATESKCNEKCRKLVEKFKREYSSGWAIRHPSIGNHYKSFNCKVCVEIGIARGELTGFLLRFLKDQVEEYYGVDPFLGGYDNKNDAMSQELAAVNSPSEWAAAILHSLAPHGCRFRLFHNISRNIIHNFPDQSVDCVFIDGDHTYTGVKEDISLWTPKIKDGGYYIFDDISYSFPGTVKAVDEFVDNHNLTIRQLNRHNNYYVQKPTKFTLPASYFP